MLIRWIIAALLALATTSISLAQEHLAAVGWGMTNAGGAVSGAAPTCGGWNVAGYADGCTGAPPAGPYAVEYPNFFTSNAGTGFGVARQSGQPSYGNVGTNAGCVNPNCHPPWAVAGVDYYVGPSCGNTCGFASPGSATDPTNVSSPNWGVGNPGGCGKVTGVNQVACSGGVIATFTGVTISGTTLTATGVTGAPHAGAVLVSTAGGSLVFGTTLVTQTGSLTWTVSASQTVTTPATVNASGMYTGTLDIGPFDFSYQGNSTGIGMGFSIASNVQVPCIIHDNYFAWDKGLSFNGSPSFGYEISGCTSVTFSNNRVILLDPTNSHLPGAWGVISGITPQAFIAINRGDPVTADIPFIGRYNAFTNCPGRCIAGTATVDLRYNYFDGLQTYDTTVPGPPHGDGYLMAFTNISCGCVPNATEINDTWLSRSDVSMGSGNSNGISCFTCSNIILPNIVGLEYITQNGNSVTLFTNTTNTSESGISHSNQYVSVSSGTLNYGGFNPTRPYNQPNTTGCPANGCGVGPPVSFNGSISGTTLTTDTTQTFVTGEFIGAGAANTVSFSGASISGTSLTASSVTGSPFVGELLSGTGVASGTVLVSGSGTAWTVSISQTVAGPETITAGTATTTSPKVVSGGTGTTFTLSVSAGTVADGPLQGVTGLGDYPVAAPWASLGSGFTGGGLYDPALATTVDIERNVEIGNYTGPNSPYWAGTPVAPFGEVISSAVQATNTTVINNYVDMCGNNGWNLAACQAPTSAVMTHFAVIGVVTTSFTEGSNVMMNNGACLYIQGSQPSSCAPIPP